MSDREKREEIADALNHVDSMLSCAKPSWSSKDGTGEWSVEYVKRAIEHLSNAVGLLAGLAKDEPSRDFRHLSRWVVPEDVCTCIGALTANCPIHDHGD